MDLIAEARGETACVGDVAAIVEAPPRHVHWQVDSNSLYGR